MDVRLKGTTDGIEAALAIRASIGSAIIFVTGSQEPETIHRMVQDPSFSVLFKPFRFHQLRDAVHRILPP
jgi:CheY-like chemotaxis protein